MVLGAVMQIVAFAILSPAPPFAVLVLGYTINGFGLAIQVTPALFHYERCH